MLVEVESEATGGMAGHGLRLINGDGGYLKSGHGELRGRLQLGWVS